MNFAMGLPFNLWMERGCLAEERLEACPGYSLIGHANL